MSSKNDMGLEKYDTIGKRLRYFREEDLGEPREKFVHGLDITPRTLERYESDESHPDAQFLTKLNAKYQGSINLDWLLTGRGNLYLASKVEPETTKEASTPYSDIIIEKMQEQLRRIYNERNFLKLATLQSLLNLLDPESKKD
ncbi:MAG: helix-turn-helix transcriptional regulator [Nitrospirae bacterium]|nr:helix-turn-helix transcriptional regulator [Nitrospirota bacterium]